MVLNKTWLKRVSNQERVFMRTSQIGFQNHHSIVILHHILLCHCPAMAVSRSSHADKFMTITVIDAGVKQILLFLQKQIEVNHNNSDDLLFVFQQRLTLSLLNFVVISLLVNMYMESMSNQSLILQGEYTDFSKKWYLEQGATICYTLFSYMGKMHGANFAMYTLFTFLRFKDRGYKRHLKKKKD